MRWFVIIVSVLGLFCKIVKLRRAMGLRGFYGPCSTSGMGFAILFPRPGFSVILIWHACIGLWWKCMCKMARFVYVGLSIYRTPTQGQFLSTRFLLIRLYRCFPFDRANLEMQEPSLSQNKNLAGGEPQLFGKPPVFSSWYLPSLENPWNRVATSPLLPKAVGEMFSFAIRRAMSALFSFRVSNCFHFRLFETLNSLYYI